MDAILRFVLLLLQAYVVLFALIGAHRLRRRYGLDLYFILIGGLIVYMWWVTRLGLDALNIGEISLPVSTVAYFCSIFATLLVVYIADGVRLTQRLILAVIGLQALFLVLEGFTYLLLSVSTPLRVALPETFLTLHWRETVWSSVALVLDMLAVVVVYQVAQNHLPRVHPILKVWLALAVALTLDTIIFVTGTGVGRDAFWGSLISQALGKIAMAGAIAPALSWYITREMEARTKGIGALEIFRSVDLLTRSLHHTKTKFNALLDRTQDVVIVLNPKGFVAQANAHFHTLLRHPPHSLEKLHYTELIHRDDRPDFVAAVTVLLESGKNPGVLSFKGLAKNGQFLHFQGQMQLLVEDGEKTGALLIWRDMTEVIVLHAKLSDLSESASLSTLKSTLVRHMAQLTTQAATASDPAQSNRIQAEVTALTRTLATLDEPEDSPLRCSVRELLDETLKLLGERIAHTGIRVETRFEDPEPHLTGVRSRLVLALVQLLDAILVQAKAVNAPSVHIHAGLFSPSANRRRLEIRLRFQGPAPELEQAIGPVFGPESGDRYANLGLAVCRHVVIRHAGELRFGTTEDGASEAVLSFPAEARQTPRHTELE